MYFNKNVCTRLWWASLKQGLIIIIQLSYTVRIPIFWLVDLYHVILGCDATTTSTSLSWCNSRVVNSTHHCHYTMASAGSEFDDLSDADIDSLIGDAITKNTKKATAWGICVLKGKVANFKFFIQASWGVFACCQQFCQLCAVYSKWVIKMLTHSLLVNYRIYLYSFTNNELEIFNTARGFWNFSFIASQLVQVNPDNSLAECVNL